MLNLSRCFAAALLIVMTLSACETVQGAGRDLQKAGEAVERVAK